MNWRTSEEFQVVAFAVSEKLPTVTDVVVSAVTLVIKTEAEVVVTSLTEQAQPWEAVGIVTTPVVAEQEVPTATVKAAVPFALAMEGEPQNPVEIVGLVALSQRTLDVVNPMFPNNDIFVVPVGTTKTWVLFLFLTVKS
jgi:hypothetical protein